MTQWRPDLLDVHVDFWKTMTFKTPSEVLERGMAWKQIRIAETEKYPHVTFFSGGRENPSRVKTNFVLHRK